MPCPSTHPISGSGSRHSAYYRSRSVAESRAEELARGIAETDARLEFNGFTCPDPDCDVKSLTINSVTVTDVDSDWSLIASAFWFEHRYTAVATYQWRATITCEAREGDARHRVAQFVDAFTEAAQARESDVWTCANGKVGNFITTFSFGIFGDGCVAWALWMLHWLYDSEWVEPPSRIEISQHHVGSWPLLHQIVIVRFPNGREFVLDPWRDPDDPVHDRDEYEREHGPIKPGFSQ